MVQQSRGRPDQTGYLGARREIGHGVAHLALHSCAVVVKRAPIATDLAGHVGESVRSEQDDSDDRDDKSLAGSRLSIPSFFAAEARFG